MRIIYQYQSPNEPVVLRHLGYPVLFSLATARACHPEAEIVVLDYDPDRHDWQDFPRRIGFEVIPESLEPSVHAGLIPILIHRPEHVRKHARGLTAYCDSDVIWLDPLPELDPAYVHMHAWNSGMLAFEEGVANASAFLDLWGETCARMRRDPWLCREVLSAEPEPLLHDESAYHYLWRTRPEQLSRWLRPLGADLFAHPWDLPVGRAGRLHLLHYYCGDRRGAVAWLLRETQPSLERFFRPEELAEALGPFHAMGGRYPLANLGEAIALVKDGLPS